MLTTSFHVNECYCAPMDRTWSRWRSHHSLRDIDGIADFCHQCLRFELDINRLRFADEVGLRLLGAAAV
jgi:hypothetical protein